MVDNLNIHDLIDRTLNTLTKKRDVDDEDFNILSTNGLLLDGMTEILENSVYKYYDASRERFISTAERRNSLTKHSRRYDEDVRFAVPATMSSMVLLPLKECFNKSEKIDERVYRYKLEKDLPIEIGEYYFEFDYDILITFFLNRKVSEHNIDDIDPEDVSINVVYDIDNTNEISDIQNPNIKSVRIRDLEVELIGLITNLRQFRRNTIENSFISRMADRNYKVSFDDQLAEFNIFYTDPDGNTEKIKKNDQVDNIRSNEKTMFYKYLTDNQILMMNRFEMGNFEPRSNSTFSFEMFETLGTDGEFEYNGDFVRAETDDNLLVRIMPQGKSVNALDTPTRTEMKERLIELNSTRDSLISTYDLEKTLERINAKYKVIKYVDDVFYRIYNIFGMIYDENNIVIPTNTLDVILNRDELTRQVTTINQGTEEEYDIVDYILPDQHTIFSYEDDAETLGTTDSLKSTEDSFEYMYPYKLIYNYSRGEEKLGNLKVFKNTFSKETTTEYEYINSLIPITYMVNSIDLISDYEEGYSIEFDLRTNTAEPVDHLHQFIVGEEHLDHPNGEPAYMLLKDGLIEIVPESYEEIHDTNIQKTILEVQSNYELIISNITDLSEYDEFKVYDSSDNLIDENIRQISSLTETSSGDYKVSFSGGELPTNIGEAYLVKIERMDVFDLELDPYVDNIYSQVKENDDDELVDKDYIRCNLMVFDNNELKGYLKVDMDDYVGDGDYFRYITNLNFQSEINSDGEIKLDLYKIVEGGDDVIETVRLSVTDLSFRLVVFSRDNVEGDFGGTTPSHNGFSVSNIFEFDSDLFDDLTYVNRVQTKPIIEAQTFQGYETKFLPLVSKTYYDNRHAKLNERIDLTLDVLDNIYDTIKDDFQISLLFINTYGPSDNFNVGLENIPLDTINLSMGFRVRKSDTSTLQRQDVRTYIVDYLDDINFLEYEDFHVSKLIRDIKNEFEDIDFIEFTGFNNGTFSADRQLITVDEDTETNTTVPEYLNIFHVFENNKLVPDITVDFV